MSNLPPPTELRERLQVLCQQESKFYKTSDYLGALVERSSPLSASSTDACDPGDSSKCGAASTGGNSNNSKVLNQHWREVMCEWAYHVIDHFDFPREIVSTCMNYLDRYLDRHLATNPVGIPKHAFQLLAMTCLYIAIKLDQPRMLSLATMAHLSRGNFNKDQMQAMEMDILNQLTWHVHPPTPYTFLSHFMQLVSPHPASNKIYEMARYFVELSVLDYFFVGQRASTVAAAALLNAVDDQPPCPNSKQNYADIAQLIVPGEEELVNQCRSRLRSLYNVPDESVFDGQQQQQGMGGSMDCRTSSPTCVSQTNVM